MNTATLTARQVGYVNKAFWRNPASAFFTFAFPLMFLVIFTSLLGNHSIEVAPGVTIQQSTYYVAYMAAFSVITACYTNIAISVTFARDSGVLKRVRGTPLPGSSYLLGRIIHAMLVAILLVAICAAFGATFYNASVPAGGTLLRFLIMLVIGAATFCALGLAVTAAVPNADAAPAIVNATILPLLFISGIFIPVGANSPQWMITLGNFFPVKHFGDAMLAGFVGTGKAFEWRDVLVVAIWGIVGLILAARYFSWEPRR
jgi:ABC-2 type transport system permease protein